MSVAVRRKAAQSKPGLAIRTRTLGLLDQLGSAIVVGRYHGQPFTTETVLSEQYGVSRAVTREVMKMLTAKGLVGARPKQGTFVRPVSHWNMLDADVLRWLLDREVSIDLLRQFTQLRLGFEPEAAALAATRATPSEIKVITLALQRMRDAERGCEDTLDADIAFHNAILLASGNPFFAQFHHVVSAALRTSIRLTNSMSGRTADIDEHADVYLAIAAGQPDKARATMRRLLGGVAVTINRAEEVEESA